MAKQVRTTQPDTRADKDRAGCIVDSRQGLILAGYDWTTGENRIGVSGTNAKQYTTLQDDAVIVAATTLWGYAEAGVSLEDWKSFSVGYTLKGGQTAAAAADVTVEMQVQVNYDGGGAGGVWFNISPSGYSTTLDSSVGVGGTVTSVGASTTTGCLDFDLISGYAMRVRFTFTGGTPDASYPATVQAFAVLKA